MKIGIDGVPLTIPFPCGTKNYAQGLISALAKIDKKNEYLIFASQKVSIPKQKNFRFVQIPSFIPILKRQIFLPFFAKKESLDIFHYLEPFGSVIFKHPKIVTTIHDNNLNYTYPWVSKFLLKRLYCEFTKGAVINNSAALLVDSRTIQKEVKEYLKNREIYPMVYAALLGYNHHFRVIKKYKNRKSKFFLGMGDFAPRKNLVSVLKGYKLLPEEIKYSHKLKIISSTKESALRFRSLAEKYAISNNIDFLENVTQERLIKLYNEASCFLYPSLYEGFGIPILEAFACGCPVITSNYGAMKETAGDAALLVDPKDPKKIMSSMKRITESNKLRNKLIVRGIKRVKEFSWKKTAGETLKAYEKLYNARV